MEHIHTDIDRIRKRLKITRASVMENLNFLIDNLQEHLAQVSNLSEDHLGDSIHALFTSVIEQEPLKKVCNQHKDSFAYIAKLSKDIEKAFPLNPEVLQCHKEKPLNETLLLKIISDYLIREGYFSSAEVLEEETKVDTDAENTRELYKNIYTLLNSLETGDIDTAMAIIQYHSDILGEARHNMIFNLHKLKFLQFLRQARTQEAVEYARVNIQPFQNTHLNEIQHLMCACIFLNQTENSPYAELLDSNYDKNIAKEIATEWCRIIGLPSQSPLLTATTAGTEVIPELMQMSSVLNNMIWKASLPVELKIKPENQFHSIFVCPVTRQIATPDNPPVLLPCGHVIARQSADSLLSNYARRKFKCPTCPTEVTESDIKPLHIF
jgi:hypothetical protein